MKSILAFFIVVLSFNTQAAIFFDINVTSETTAVITGSGSLDQDLGIYATFGFDDVFTAISPFNPNLSTDSTMSVAGNAMWSSFYGISDGSGYTADLYTQTLNFESFVGDTVTGTANLDLTGTDFTFQAVGTTGNVYDSILGSNVIGTWSIGTVPEPSILALMGLGLAGLGFARRRHTQT